MEWIYVRAPAHRRRLSFVCGNCATEATEGVWETLDILLGSIRGFDEDDS
jgi:hypothetical protein